MLIINNQRAKRTRGDLLCEDRSSGAVAQESLMLVQLRRSIFGFELLLAFSNHEGFSLSEEVGREHLLVLVVCDGVMGFSGEDEIGGDELGALV